MLIAAPVVLQNPFIRGNWPAPTVSRNTRIKKELFGSE